MHARPLLAAAILLSACGAEPREVTAADPEVARVAAENNAFTLDLHKALAAEGGNLFHSPFSANAALSMTWAGARGTTADEMADVLHMEADAPHHGPLGGLIRDLNGEHRRAYTLDVANRIWGHDSYTWSSEFQAINADSYDAPMVITDIKGNPEATRTEINSWVADVTHDKIPELLAVGLIDGSTAMVLVNAIYFKADWAQAFEEKDTYAAPFYRLDGSSVDVDTMHGEMEVAIASGEGFSAAGLPYGEDAEVRMWVLLPDEDSDLPSLEASLDAASLDAALNGAGIREEVQVALPKLELRTQVNLNQPLADLGMPSAFDPIEADFSGMIEGAPAGGSDLFIGDVVHEAYVKIDERGTEAAAATAVIMNDTAFEEPQVFTIDRPFLFLVRDELSGAILFMGRIEDPSTASAQ